MVSALDFHLLADVDDPKEWDMRGQLEWSGVGSLP